MKNPKPLKTKTVKIIAGTFKGVKLLVPPSGTHPMGERERNALFNMLGPDLLQNASVLDLFAGTGALGLEALSRGASKAAFVDNSTTAIKNLKSTIKALQLESQTSVIKSTVNNLSTTEKFDLVFVDPPYDRLEFFEDLSYYTHFVKSNGHLILSYPKDLIISTTGKLKLIKSHSYAAATIAIFSNL